MNPITRAILMMIAGMLLIPVGDAFAKALSASAGYSGAGMAWARFVVGAVLIAPFAWWTGLLADRGAAFWGAQLLRGGLLSAVIAFIVQGAQTEPLADVFGAFFIGPAIATCLARWLLKERVDRADWAAVTLGFIGVALVVKPTGQIAPGLLWALGAGLLYGGFLAATRWTAQVGPPMAQLAGQLIVGSILLAPFALPEFLAEGVVGPGLLLGSGLSSALANLLAILAFREARAALLTPLVYTQLISAAALSWAVFGDAPDFWSTLGILVILAAGLGRFLPAPPGTRPR